MFKWLTKIFKKPIPPPSSTMIDGIDPEAVTVGVQDKVPAKDQESKAVQIGQFMVTHSMRRELRDLGYNKFQIDELSPDQAADRIKRQQGPNG